MRRLRLPRVGVREQAAADSRPKLRHAVRSHRRVVVLVLVVALFVAAWLLTRAVLGGRDSTWARIQETGVWRVGMDPSFPPFENLDPGTKNPIGLDVDLINAIAARWGVKAEVVGVGFDELVDAVTARRVDTAISALPVFDYRAKEVAFSAPYVEAGVVLAVPSGSPIRGQADLAGRQLAAEWGSSGDAQARVLQRELEGNLRLVLRESADAALAAVLSGEADAAAVDAISLALFDRGQGRLVQVGKPLQSDPYVAIVPVDAPRLLAAINEALAALEADDTLSQIRTRWLDR